MGVQKEGNRSAMACPLGGLNGLQIACGFKGIGGLHRFIRQQKPQLIKAVLPGQHLKHVGKLRHQLQLAALMEKPTAKTVTVVAI